jgi:multidrug efflux pump subunit AcrA (membrane-fusion protein)
MNAGADVKTVVAGMVVAAASIAAACSERPRAAEPERAPAKVSIGQVAMARVATRFEAGGIVRASGTALVASRIAAPIARVHVRAGDRVRRGAVLVTLDAREVQANRTRAAAASLSAAEAARAAEADVRAADSTLVLARATHDRISALHTKRSATAQELDQAVAALAAADAQAAGARARQAAANAARDAAEAAADSADIGTTYAVLRAPFDGIVTERLADPGSMALPGTTLLVLEDPSAFRLETQIDEARAALVAAGQAVEVRIDTTDAGSEAWIRGRVIELARVDPASHSFLIKVELPATPGLRSGLFGRARFAGATRQTLTVPRSAVVRRGQLTFVFLLDDDRRARLRPVSVAAVDDHLVEALAGLRERDAIVLTPPASLTDGTRLEEGRP